MNEDFCKMFSRNRHMTSDRYSLTHKEVEVEISVISSSEEAIKSIQSMRDTFLRAPGEKNDLHCMV
jgi:hypothetical protein